MNTCNNLPKPASAVVLCTKMYVTSPQGSTIPVLPCLALELADQRENISENVVLDAGQSQGQMHLAELGPWSILSGGTGHLEAQPVVQAQGVQLLGVQHPSAAFGHAQEPLLVVDVDRVLVDLVPQLCNTSTLASTAGKTRLIGRRGVGVVGEVR